MNPVGYLAALFSERFSPTAPSGHVTIKLPRKTRPKVNPAGTKIAKQAHKGQLGMRWKT